MKRLKQSAAAKIIAVILAAITLASAVMLLFLSAYMLSNKYYTSPYSVILEQTEYECAYTVHDVIAAEIRTALYNNSQISSDELVGIISSISDERNFRAEVCIGKEQITPPYGGSESSSQHSKPIEFSSDLLDGYLYSKKLHDRFGENAEIVTKITVDRSYPHTDIFSSAAFLSRTAYNMRYAVVVLGLLSCVLLIVSYVFSVSAAGHRRGVDGFYVSMLDRIPLDLLLVITAAAIAVESALINDLFQSRFVLYGYYSHFYNSYVGEILSFSAIGLLLFAGGAALTVLSMTVASRIKSGVVIKYNITTYMCRAFARGMRYVCRAVMLLPIVWRTLLGSVATVIVSFYLIVMACTSYDGVPFFLILTAFWLCLTGLACYRAYCMHRLRLAGKRLASGDLSHRADTANLYGDYRHHADDLNNIGVGMAAAVEERIKSERFKTELITNVSHDLKTPLTSIINYIDLLKTPGLDEQTERDYIDIIDRQAGKLRRLTEDLVEASKASSGALPVSLSLCDLSLLVSQVAGEYEERLAAQELKLIVKKPDFPVNAMADGRHTARILDNLMSNVSKYSLSGTRVYLELKIAGNFAGISLCNISREPVDVAPDELTERFVRGDASRHTEGSGLGLSIARSLAELQDGVLAIETDGDLFRATLWFKIVSCEVDRS